MSIQQVYREFRDGKFLINRRYQRKLVWTEQEKARLIDSILQGFPIPLILLAIHNADSKENYYFEIIDGMQRIHAITTFIENQFCLEDGRYFDVRENPRAKQAAEAGEFWPVYRDSLLPNLLSQDECNDFLEYQLAVTQYPANDNSQINEIFGRINSTGRQLSTHDRRQAGVTTLFADMIRKISSEIRGDSSPEILRLQDMPQISIGSKSSNAGYGLKAEDTFWCKQGILWSSSLRSSQDEELLADIAASILLNEPFSRSQEEFNNLYDENHETFLRVERALLAYGPDLLMEQIKTTFSVLRETITSYSTEENALRNVVSGIRNELKTPFYAIFMAFFDLVIKQEKSPIDPNGIMKALRGVSKDMERTRHYTTSFDRKKNINKTLGLIQEYFVTKEPPAFRQGSGLALDLENSLRRASIETPRYEFKQGILKLYQERNIEENIFEKITKTFCAMANQKLTSYLFFGIADKDKDAERISDLDKIQPVKVGKHYVVGVGWDGT